MCSSKLINKKPSKIIREEQSNLFLIHLSTNMLLNMVYNSFVLSSRYFGSDVLGESFWAYKQPWNPRLWVGEKISGVWRKLEEISKNNIIAVNLQPKPFRPKYEGFWNIYFLVLGLWFVGVFFPPWLTDPGGKRFSAKPPIPHPNEASAWFEFLPFPRKECLVFLCFFGEIRKICGVTWYFLLNPSKRKKVPRIGGVWLGKNRGDTRGDTRIK